MKRTLIALAAAATALTAVPASAANLLQNGSFEVGGGSFAGWGVTNSSGTAPVVIAYNQASQYPTGAFGESIPTDNAAGNPSSDAAGLYGAYFSTDTGTSALTQTITLGANTRYTFGFDYYLPRNGFANPNNARVTATLSNGNALENQQINFALAGETPGVWAFQSQAGSFTTGNVGGTFTLTFGGSGTTAKDVVIDRVFLNAVPEPATWGMMILGFGVIGYGMRRRQRASVSFA